MKHGFIMGEPVCGGGDGCMGMKKTGAVSRTDETLG